MPLRVFCRKSFVKYLDQEEFFKITYCGIDYYKEFFGVGYQFGKYDQVLVPEFNSGAMENTGLVTYNEAYFRFEKGK